MELLHIDIDIVAKEKILPNLLYYVFLSFYFKKLIYIHWHYQINSFLKKKKIKSTVIHSDREDNSRVEKARESGGEKRKRETRVEKIKGK